MNFLASSLKANNHSSLLAFIIVASVLLTIEPTLNSVGTYEREAVGNGELWRILVSMFVHLNTAHLIVNIVACSALVFMLSEWAAPKLFIAILCICGSSTSMMLYGFAADVQWYCGMSGSLHGVAVWGALTMLQQGSTKSPIIPVKTCAWVLLIVMALKLLYEQSGGHIVTTYDFPVLTLSHVYGAATGVILFCFMFCLRRIHVNHRATVD